MVGWLNHIPHSKGPSHFTSQDEVFPEPFEQNPSIQQPPTTLLPTPIPLPFWECGASPKWTMPTPWTEPLIWGAIVWWEQGSPHKWLVSLLLWSFTVCVELYGLLPYSPPISWWGLLNDYSTLTLQCSLICTKRRGGREWGRDREGNLTMHLEGWLANTAGPATVEGW